MSAPSVALGNGIPDFPSAPTPLGCRASVPLSPTVITSRIGHESPAVELPPEQQTPEQKKVFEQLVAGRGRILGPYKIWIHSPTVASGMEHIGTYLNKKGSLSEREVEIGILVIAQHWDADYVRAGAHQDGQAGRAVAGDHRRGPGRPRSQADRSARARRAPLCRGAGRRREASDAEFAEIEKAIGRDGVAEVLVLIGYYTSVALGMKVHQVPIPPE